MSEEGNPTPPSGGDRTFTQQDVDRIVAERLRREREKVEAAEKRAADLELKALRAEVAQAKGLTPAQAKRLSGSTREELEADADDLLEAFGGKKDAPKEPEKKEPEGDGKDDDKETETPPFGRPKERLTPGAAPAAEPEKSDDDLADAVLKRTRGL